MQLLLLETDLPQFDSGLTRVIRILSASQLMLLKLQLLPPKRTRNSTSQLPDAEDRSFQEQHQSAIPQLLDFSLDQMCVCVFTGYGLGELGLRQAVSLPT